MCALLTSEPKLGQNVQYNRVTGHRLLIHYKPPFAYETYRFVCNYRLFLPNSWKNTSFCVEHVGHVLTLFRAFCVVKKMSSSVVTHGDARIGMRLASEGRDGVLQFKPHSESSNIETERKLENMKYYLQFSAITGEPMANLRAVV